MQGRVVTKEERTQRFNKLSPSLEIVGKVKNLRDRVKVRCKRCGHTQTRRGVFSRAVLCDACTEGKVGVRMVHGTFCKRVQLNSPTLRVKSRYQDICTPVQVECLDCGLVFSALPQRLLYKKSEKTLCPSCYVPPLRLTPLEYRRRLAKKRSDLELLDEYSGYQTSLRFRSRVCGHVFVARPDPVLNGNQASKGCRQCTLQTQSIKGNEKEFLERLKKKHPNLRLLSSYLGLSKPCTFQCVEDLHTFDAPPARVLSSKFACLECSRRATGYRFVDVTIQGKQFRVQGYEPTFLKKLAKHYPRLFQEVEHGKEVPSFRYRDISPTTRRPTVRVYRPDFYLPSINTIVEVKSNYTAAGKPEWLETLKKKRKTVIQAGYRFSLVVFNDRGDRLPVVSNWYNRKLTANSLIQTS